VAGNINIYVGGALNAPWNMYAAGEQGGSITLASGSEVRVNELNVEGSIAGSIKVVAPNGGFTTEILSAAGEVLGGSIDVIAGGTVAVADLQAIYQEPPKIDAGSPIAGGNVKITIGMGSLKTYGVTTRGDSYGSGNIAITFQHTQLDGLSPLISGGYYGCRA
jgi:hypothetical protein